MKIEMTIWDNDITTEEKLDILLSCERAACRVYRNTFVGPTLVKVTDRFFAGCTLNISIAPELQWKFARAYNNYLIDHVPYWNRADEPLEMKLEMN